MALQSSISFAAALDAAGKAHGRLKLAALALALVGLGSLQQTYQRNVAHETKIAALLHRQDQAAREIEAIGEKRRNANLRREEAEKQIAQAISPEAREKAAEAAEEPRQRIARYERQQRDVDTLRQDVKNELAQQQQLLAAQQSFEILGVRLPMPSFLVPTAWLGTLALIIGLMLTARHRLFRALPEEKGASPGPGASDKPAPSAPFWLAPLPARIGQHSRVDEWCLALGWSPSTYRFNMALSVLCAIAALLLSLRVTWLGLMLGWSGSGTFALSVPPAPTVSVSGAMVATSVLLLALVVLAFLACWLAPSLTWTRFPDLAETNGRRRIVVLGSVGLGALSLGGIVASYAAGTRKLQDASRRGLRTSIRTVTCRFRRRRHPAVDLGEPKVAAGLYTASKSSGRPVQPLLPSAPPPARAATPANVYVVDQRGWLIGVGPRFNRQALRPLEAQPIGPLRRGIGATEEIERIAILRALNGDGRGAVAFLLYAAVGAETRGGALIQEGDYDKLRAEMARPGLKLAELRSNVRLLDLAAKLAMRERLSEELRLVAAVTAGHAAAMKGLARRRARGMRTRVSSSTPDARLATELLAQLGLLKDRPPGGHGAHRSRSGDAKVKAVNGEAVREKRLAAALSARAAFWDEVSTRTTPGHGSASRSLTWGGRVWTPNGSSALVQRGRSRPTGGGSCIQKPPLTRRALLDSIRVRAVVT